MLISDFSVKKAYTKALNTQVLVIIITKPGSHFMKKIVVSILLIIPAIFCYSQSFSVKGELADTVEFKKIPNAVVSLLRSKDSVLTRFARTDKDGRFSITAIKPGNYIIMITHPYLGDRFEDLEISNEKKIYIKINNFY